MKTFSFFAICFGISFCIAQTNPDTNYNPTGGDNPTGEDPNTGSEVNTNGTEETNPNGEYNQGESNNYNQQSNEYNRESNEGWDRSDYYESPKQPERVQYYSGGHRGTNIINPKNDQYDARDESGNRRGETDFPDLVRYYSGGYYGNNVINKNKVDRVKDVYMGNPVNDYNNQNNNNNSDYNQENINQENINQENINQENQLSE